jgi:Na+/glutamate symporter
VDAVLEGAAGLEAGLAAGLAAATFTVFAGGLLGSGSSRGSIFRRDDVRLDAVLLLSDELLLFSFTIAAQNWKKSAQNIWKSQAAGYFVMIFCLHDSLGDIIDT